MKEELCRSKRHFPMFFAPFLGFGGVRRPPRDPPKWQFWGFWPFSHVNLGGKMAIFAILRVGGRFLALFGPFWAPFGPPFGAFGTPFWGPLGPFERGWDPLWGLLGPQLEGQLGI